MAQRSEPLPLSAAVVTVYVAVQPEEQSATPMPTVTRSLTCTSLRCGDAGAWL
jgi:hypothetical protein